MNPPPIRPLPMNIKDINGKPPVLGRIGAAWGTLFGVSKMISGIASGTGSGVTITSGAGTGVGVGVGTGVGVGVGTGVGVGVSTEVWVDVSTGVRVRVGVEFALGFTVTVSDTGP